MPEYRLNRKAVSHAKRLIDAGRLVESSDWGESQPKADEENAFLLNHRHKEIELAAHRLLQYVDKKLGPPQR